MDRAERAVAIPEHAADDLNINTEMTAERLRSQLNRIVKAPARERLLYNRL